MNPQFTAWCGIDVSKATFDASLVTSQSLETLADIPVAKFARDQNGVEQLVPWIESHTGNTKCAVRIVMEATGSYSLELATWILMIRPDLAPSIMNPCKVSYFHKSLGLRNKTDQIDARVLGLFGKERQPPPFESPQPEYQRLKKLHRLRLDLVETKTAESLRLSEAKDPLIREMIAGHLDFVKKQLQDLEFAMRDHVLMHRYLAEDISRLCSIPGVGFITAAAVLAECGDLRRYKKSRQIAAMAGLTPRIRQSGTSVHAKSRISRAGNASLRKSLFMPALVAIQKSDSCLAQFYRRLVESGKAKKAAICAVMRKLLVLMRALLVHETVYNQNYKTEGKSVEKRPKFHPRLRLIPKF